ncbi:MAG: phosphoenolpyruvate--protein phosphotransferase [Spirochaetales bacterium]|nr:phosphoenolpyruvate--protein phosphotransferase [Spirochaetales bacterium]
MQKKRKDRKQEVKYLKSLKLNLDLLYVFLGEKKGTELEKEQLEKYIEEMQNEIYIEAVYLLTHTYPQNQGEAKKIVVDIIKHRNRMVDLLQRNVSIQVATLDYQENIRNILLEPKIIKIDNFKELAKVSIVDTSTLAYDKRLFLIDLEKEVDRTKRLNAYISLMFIDIEDINISGKTYEKADGLDLLKYVSGCIHASLRKYDSVYGYGRNKFVILLPLTNTHEVEGVAERILKSIRSKESDDPQGTPDINIGITSFKGDDLRNGKEVVIAAENALAEAKKNGKNQIYVSRNNSIYRCKLSSQEFDVYMSVTIKGRPLVGGYALGNVFHYHDIESRHIEVRDINKDEIPKEMERIRDALKKMNTDYKDLQLKVNKTKNIYDTEIFDVYISLLEDIMLPEELEKKLNEDMVNAEQVVKSVFHQLVRKFRSSESLLIREKAGDIEDIGKRLLNKLTGMEENVLSMIPENSIIFTKRLLPSDIVHLKQKNTKAIITEQGGDASHAAIMARNLGIPSITDIAINHKDIPEGAQVLINGYEGVVIINPPQALKNEVMKEIEKVKLESIRLFKATKNKDLRIGDERIYVDANVPANPEILNEYSGVSDTIGLFRIEPIYMQTSSLPSETGIFKELYRLFKHLKKKHITIRLTDFGDNKIPAYITSSDEHKSSLGFMGIRFLFEYPEILTDQLRVCLQLSAHFKIRILIPRVTLVDDMIIVRDLLETQMELFSKKRIKFDKEIQLGALIELPSAYFAVREIADHSDFLSIGTNNLIQYTMAADRQLLGVSSYYERGNLLIISLIKTLVDEAKETHTPVDICGELAGNTRFTEYLLNAGLRRFSVAPFLIPQVKNKIYSIITAKKP